MCGADYIPNDVSLENGGTSPHTRGRYGFGKLSEDIFRLIPAYAGQMDDILPHNSCSKAHPRMCGADP